MTIHVTDVYAITEAIETTLKENADLTDLELEIEVGEQVNEDVNRCPWAGIYRQGIRYPSRTLGAGSGYRQQRIGIVIVLQHADTSSGRQCSQRLEDLIKKTMSALLSDESLRGLVDILDEVDISYTNYNFDSDNGYFMQTAAVQFVGLVNVTRG